MVHIYCIFKPSYNLFDCSMCDTRHVVASVRFGFAVASNLFRAKTNVVVISIAIRMKYKRSNMIKKIIAALRQLFFRHRHGMCFVSIHFIANGSLI